MSYQTVTPYLVTSDAAAATEFYIKALGAEELARHAAPDGKRLMHVRLRILGMEIMMSDDFSDHMGGKAETPLALGGSTISLALRVEDAQVFWDRAVAGGARVTMPLKDQFWGDRYGQFIDPFGHKWSVSQTLKTPTAAEIEEGAKASFAKPDTTHGG